MEKVGKREGWEVGVVSVNWSGGFIRGVVGEGCGGLGLGKGMGRVVANGVVGGVVEGPGELGREVLVTAGDKMRAMGLLREGKGEGERVVYFGDSPTDLACLLEADLGVVIADDGGSKLLKTLERIGLEVPHLGEGKDGRLVWARDFEEVLESGVMDRI